MDLCWPAHPDEVLATEAVASTIAFAIITFLHVVLGELFPKTGRAQVPDTTSLWVAQPLAVFTALTESVDPHHEWRGK